MKWNYIYSNMEKGPKYSLSEIGKSQKNINYVNHFHKYKLKENLYANMCIKKL